MELDLYSVRQSFTQQRVLLAFNGSMTQSLIEELGKALRNHLQDEDASSNAAMDVFSVYIEMTQNIRHYMAAHAYQEHDAAAVVVIGRHDNGAYFVSAGNTVEIADGQRLAQRVESLFSMDKAALKAAYKEQLRRPRDESASTGAGLGLIDMARKASAPLTCSLRSLDNGKAFLSLYVTI
jgi:hypothetical protein